MRVQLTKSEGPLTAFAWAAFLAEKSEHRRANFIERTSGNLTPHHPVLIFGDSHAGASESVDLRHAGSTGGFASPKGSSGKMAGDEIARRIQNRNRREFFLLTSNVAHDGRSPPICPPNRRYVFAGVVASSKFETKTQNKKITTCFTTPNAAFSIYKLVGL